MNNFDAQKRKKEAKNKKQGPSQKSTKDNFFLPLGTFENEKGIPL